MRQFFPTLKRWKEKDERALTEKATGLLAQCKDITIASIDAEGFPRPVPMSKISSKGCNEVWLATAANSVKVTDFKLNNKAGLCYSNYGDSVGLTDLDFVLLHFVGKETTFWINEEFAHE